MDDTIWIRDNVQFIQVFQVVGLGKTIMTSVILVVYIETKKGSVKCTRTLKS